MKLQIFIMHDHQIHYLFYKTIFKELHSFLLKKCKPISKALSTPIQVQVVKDKILKCATALIGSGHAILIIINKIKLHNYDLDSLRLIPNMGTIIAMMIDDKVNQLRICKQKVIMTCIFRFFRVFTVFFCF